MFADLFIYWNFKKKNDKRKPLGRPDSDIN